MIAPNTVVGGRYRVLKPLGGGGMKLVYLAEDLRLAARPCALAEMVDSFTDAETQRRAVESFQREADMLATLSNEHIPRIFDRFSDHNHHYLVMEYIAGATLEDLMREAGGRLEPERVVEIAVQILDTLAYLHSLNPPVVYRDLKPSNIMLTEAGVAKLIDFGIARHFQPSGNATMIGTQGYAPPEQYRGKVELRSDLYSLGATMHHALSGRDPAVEAPFSFPPIRSKCPDLSPALARVIDQSLKYNVEDRVPDAAEFKRRLLKASQEFSSAPPSMGRFQLNLPLSRPTPSTPVSAEAPTLRNPPHETRCPQCGRGIPLDSRFCSFCAADLRETSGGSQPSSEAETAVLGGHAGTSPSERLRPYGTRRRRGRARSVRFLFLLMMGFFAGAFVLTELVALMMTQPGSTPGGSDYGPIPYPSRRGSPGSSGTGTESREPPHRSARGRALRAALDRQGYESVHFRFEGDTIVLWGTVPTEADRIMVQTMVFTVAQTYSIEDHLVVHGGFAEF